MLYFRSWLLESILAEVAFQFGAHRGKDHTDSSIPVSYLQWVLANVNHRTVDNHFKDQLRQEINRRQTKAASGKSPVPAEKPATPTKTWVLAKAINTVKGLNPGEYVVVTRQGNGWVILTQNWQTIAIPNAEEIKNAVSSEKDNHGNPITSSDPEELFAHAETLEEPDNNIKQPTTDDDNNKKEEEPFKLSEEQELIDKKFEKLMQNPNQSHIMINALAGTGKTTTLKNLAWKYGNTKQKWLYLVFGAKNKVEAQEKFPSWVKVATTNGFFGEILENSDNKLRIKQTKRVVDMDKHIKKKEGEEDAVKIEKARVLADSDKFGNVMSELGLPHQNQARGLNHLTESAAETVFKLLRSIRYEFKEQVLKLLGLTKAFAVDPRKKEALQSGLQKIFDAYDIDTKLGEIKDRIDRYSPNYAHIIRDSLRKLMGYDFLSKDFTNEMKEATAWMMEETLPHASQQLYKRGDIEHNLGHYRDFNDDLWYAAIHSDELIFPHFDVALADEVQDFNEAQKVVLKKLHDAGAKIVAVGDPNQAIYRFRGADGQAFDNLGKMLNDLSSDKETNFALSKNFRSRPEILDFANRTTHVNNLVSGKKFTGKAPDRIVTDQEITYDDAFAQLKQEKDMTGKIKETAFISRTNDPLVHAALKLLANGIPFVIIGRDVAKELIRHIDKIMRFTKLADHLGVDALAEKLDSHEQKEAEYHSGSSAKKAYLQELKDTTAALLAAIDQFNPQNNYNNNNKAPSIAQFKVWLKAKLAGLDVNENERDFRNYRRKLEQEKPVILTTAHKAKGLEFDRVYILRDDLFPHPKEKRPEGLAQEANAKYVARTRGKDELHVLKLKGQPGYKDDDEEDE